MAKVGGIPVAVSIDDSGGNPQVLTNFIKSIAPALTRASAEVTGMDKSAPERIQLLSDGKLTVTGAGWDPAGLAHTVFSTFQSSTATRTVVIGYPGPKTLTMEMNIDSYNVPRGDDGALTWTAELSLANGTAPAWG